MKTIKTEMGKPRIWLDPGVMLSIDEDFGISAILYRRGFFSRWKIVSESTSDLDVIYLFNKIRSSFGKSVRTTNGVVLNNENELYRKLVINILEITAVQNI